MNFKEKALFGLLSKVSFGEHVIYSKMYENISKEIRKQYGNLVPADKHDFSMMIPNQDYNMYIHIPFCDTLCKKCPYDKVTKFELFDRYCEALTTEMKIIARQKWDKHIKPIGIFIGGGTPSVLPLENMRDLVTNIKSIFIKNSTPEFTLEINPKSSSVEKIDEWIGMGINRFSIGVQSFNNNVLNYYNRNHGGEISEELCRYLSKIGFNYNIDLLFGFDGHEQKDFMDDINKAIDISVPHITIYPYFEGEINKEKYKHQKKMYESARRHLLLNGYYQYTIFDFCKENDKKSIFWEGFTNHDNIALGVGGSGGTIEKGAYTKYSDIEVYCESIEQEKPAFFKKEGKEQAKMNILTLYGLDIDRKQCIDSYGVDPYLDQKEIFDILKAVGHVKIDKNKIYLKNYFRQIFLWTLCFFVDMKEPLKEKLIEMKNIK
jgi:oxygen-independent coproporphyrinogen-3 oxidase